jgi:glycosyltransferase involved in cell wall biosynthesis
MWHLSKIPQTLHCYWGGKKLSYLRYLTLESFKYFNPDWKIILYTPFVLQKSFYWNTPEQVYGDNYVNYYDRIKGLGITIQEIDFVKIGFYNDAAEVHKSDYLRWWLLSTVGGVWADMDILFIKPMDELCFNKLELSNIDTVFCFGSYGYSIGFLMSSENNRYFKTIHLASKKEYKKEGYQSIGVLLCAKVFSSIESIMRVNSNSYCLPMDIVYAYQWDNIKEVFDIKCINKITNNTIGIHWYGGSKVAGIYQNNTNGGLYCQGNSMMDMQIRRLKILTNPDIDPVNLKISVIMAFYNRQALLDKTLESLDKSEIKDYELIIVDDASAVPLVCDRAKIIRVEKKDKWYSCSCVAWNMGMREATGNIIILNSPECYHVGDILSYVRDNIRPNLYLSFGCYAINKIQTEEFNEGKMPQIENRVVDSNNGWYNHTQHRPVAYHFCSAILRGDLDEIGGFDERYAYGFAFDDDEFIRTIRYMGMEVKIVDNPYVIHQFHTHFEFESPSVWGKPHALNESIYNQGYNPKIHRDYGRNNDSFDPIHFQEVIEDEKLKKKQQLWRNSHDGLGLFLKKLGGV